MQIGGGVGIADNLKIGDGARIGANSGVINDIPPGESWMGVPAGKSREQLHNYAAFRRLGEIARDVKRLKKASEGCTEENPGNDKSSS